MPAESARSSTRVLQRREIFRYHGFDDHILAVHAAVLDSSSTKTADLREQVERAILFVQILLITCTRTDGSRRAVAPTRDLCVVMAHGSEAGSTVPMIGDVVLSESRSNAIARTQCCRQ